VRVNAALKVGCLVAGMAAGADSVDDMGLLRHGAMGVLFGGVRAPSTLNAAISDLQVTRKTLISLAGHDDQPAR
jgi:hypothetical protein